MSTLQATWFVLVGLLFGGYAVLDGFDLGIGLWHPFAREEEHRQRLFAAIGPFWDGNEVWLLAGGGALFAAFPPVYATVFSALYVPLMLVLLGLIFRAVAIEVRSLDEAPAWRRAWDWAFALGSLLPALLFGVAVGNLVRGLALDGSGNHVAGFGALLNPYSLAVGLAGLAMFAMHGACFAAARLDGELRERARLWAARLWPAHLGLFVLVAGWSLAAHQRGSRALPAAAALVALGAIVAGRLLGQARSDGKALLASGVAILGQLAAVGATLYPNLVVAANDPARSLSIFDASSSRRTLTVMLVTAVVGMPLVLAYTVFVYRTFWRPPPEPAAGDGAHGSSY